jgi:hypothetical protein
VSPLASARSAVLARRLPRGWFAPEPALEATVESAASEPIIEVNVIRRLGAASMSSSAKQLGDRRVVRCTVAVPGERDLLAVEILRGRDRAEARKPMAAADEGLPTPRNRARAS